MKKIEGFSALISAASYIFAIGLLMTMMTPLTDPDLDFNEYMDFLNSHRKMIFIWNFLLYIIHGGTLVILVLALYLEEQTLTEQSLYEKKSENKNFSF